MQDWHVGQLVVCIASSWVYQKTKIKPQNIKCPQKNFVYTIRGVKDYGLKDLYLVFEEINDGGTKIEPYFNCTAFRPVKKTSIEVFTEILNKVPKSSIKHNHA